MLYEDNYSKGLVALADNLQASTAQVRGVMRGGASLRYPVRSARVTSRQGTGSRGIRHTGNLQGELWSSSSPRGTPLSRYFGRCLGTDFNLLTLPDLGKK